MAGVRTVLKNDNVVEAVAICDATPGPVARLAKLGILNRDQSHERLREMIDDHSRAEVPRLEKRLNMLGTIAQIAPLLGLPLYTQAASFDAGSLQVLTTNPVVRTFSL